MQDNARTVRLDLTALAEERGPHPNDFFICLTRREAAACAACIAIILSEEMCPQPECDNCNNYRRLFWNLVNDLGPRVQSELFRYLEAGHIAIPDGPWEEALG